MIFYYTQRHGNGSDMSNEIRHYLVTLIIFKTALRQDDIFSRKILVIDGEEDAMQCASDLLNQCCLPSNFKRLQDYPDVCLMYITAQDPIQETAAFRANYEAKVKKIC